ncbi:hypothetical protein Aph01nite_33490 [Acrocarpospora phusangensis]|uniref:Peptidase S8/S53 domain-containing protein n=1 Tax=Acrocarpospora phusangensis TaxID=1070424 RepID=A0A919UKH7_9ACTN|nr:S8/S53 family peptidase [Acrocarpospora phusangensis]GIH25039.1 hypothetical protein Aph01nite_33490 [Acrocarpospora phusangensis]
MRSHDTADTRFWQQLNDLNVAAKALNALPGDSCALAGPKGADDPGLGRIPAAYAYLSEHVLVHRDNVDRAIRVIRRDDASEPVHVALLPDEDRDLISVRRLFIGRRDIYHVIELLNREEDIEATPVHFISVATGNLCSADEPVPRIGPLNPPLSALPHGRGVKVVVFDTGLVDGYDRHSWLAEINGPRPIPKVDGDVLKPGAELDVDDGSILPHAGHGTFVAGVLRCVAPATTVYVSDAMKIIGAGLEDQVCLVIMRTLKAMGWPDIICLPAGTSTDHDKPLLGFSDFRRDLADHPDTLLVAAAGNDGKDEPFWPAALAESIPDMVVSVGALRADGRGRACFSNYGDWVSVYAPGERMVNAFIEGTYSYDYDARTTCRFHPHNPSYLGCPCVAPISKGEKLDLPDALAQWSGTSFATPIVTGLIAAYMTRTGKKSREAAKDLLQGRLAIPDLSGLWL